MNDIVMIALFSLAALMGYWLRWAIEKLEAEKDRYAEVEKLAKRNYTITVRQEQLSDRSVYIAKTVEFPNVLGCGKTEQDAVADLCAGRVDYIAYLLKHSLPVPEPKGETK